VASLCNLYKAFLRAGGTHAAGAFSDMRALDTAHGTMHGALRIEPDFVAATPPKGPAAATADATLPAAPAPNSLGSPSRSAPPRSAAPAQQDRGASPRKAPASGAPGGGRLSALVARLPDLSGLLAQRDAAPEAC
jgi:hypothetical protein